ncbi:MAG: cupredoxin family copper-binding protein [Sphingomicrobium sp.]|nr:cupredoxin family copper-binding protein [Sphingomonadales bacterium]
MVRLFQFALVPALSLAATAFLLSPIPVDAHAAPAAAAPIVRIENFTFAQPVMTVKRGTTVTWVNGDDIPHTVTAKNLAFKSKVLDTGDRFSFTFAKAGQFDYFCSLHPHMAGKIVVKA